MHCTICFLYKAHLGKEKLIVREEWLLSQCLVLHMGSHSSFLPAVVCTLEKALNSYNSDTDPTNPANPMPRCAPLPCERQIWTFTTNGTPRFREVARPFPQPQPKGEQQGHSQRSYTAIMPSREMGSPEAHGGWSGLCPHTKRRRRSLWQLQVYMGETYYFVTHC